jgi:hypothetical protein
LQLSSRARKPQHTELYRKGSALFGKECYHTVLHTSSATELLQFPEPKNPRLVLGQQNNRNLVRRSPASRKTRHIYFPEGLQDFRVDFRTSAPRKRPWLPALNMRALTTPLPVQQLMTRETPRLALTEMAILY